MNGVRECFQSRYCSGQKVRAYTEILCATVFIEKPLWLLASPIGTGPRQEQALQGHTEEHEGPKELDLPLTSVMQMFFA